MPAEALADLPESWTVWSDGDGGRTVLAYRPDVFDSARHPAPCLPTLYVSRRPPNRRKRRGERPGDDWHVALYLEPDVRVRDCDHTRETRADALAAAVDVATAFDAGEVDYRGAYQVPREEYLDALDELTGGGDNGDA